MFRPVPDLSSFLYPDLLEGRQPVFYPDVNSDLALECVSLPSSNVDYFQNAIGATAWSAISTTGLSVDLTNSGKSVVNASSGYLKRTNNVTTGPLTVGLVFTPANTSDASKGIFSIADGYLSGTPYLLIQQNGADLRIFFAGGYRITFSGILVANKPNSIVVTISSVGNVSADIFCGVNGVWGTYSGSGGTNSMTWQFLFSGYTGFAKGAIPLFYCFRKYLDGFAGQFSVNPWQKIFHTSLDGLWFPPPAGGITLSGAAFTPQYGAIGPNSAIPQTGQSSTLSAGSIVASIDYLSALTGLSSTAVYGAFAPALIANLTGAASTTAQGAMSAVSDIFSALTGLSAAPNIGALIPGALTGLTGGEVLLSPGSVASSQDTLQALTGLLTTGSLGSLAADLTAAISGIESILGRGDVTPLTGIISQLTGIEASALQGALSTAVTRILSGQSAPVEQGSPLPGISFSLSGTEATSSANAVGVTVQIGQSGATLTLANGIVTVLNSDVTLGLTGTQALSQFGALAKETQAFLFGQDLVLSQGQLFSVIEALGLGQSITLVEGTSSVTIERSLSGITAISGNGTVVFADNNVQVSLLGDVITTSVGRIYIKGAAFGNSSITILQV